MPSSYRIEGEQKINGFMHNNLDFAARQLSQQGSTHRHSRQAHPPSSSLQSYEELYEAERHHGDSQEECYNSSDEVLRLWGERARAKEAERRQQRMHGICVETLERYYHITAVWRDVVDRQGPPRPTAEVISAKQDLKEAVDDMN